MKLKTFVFLCLLILISIQIAWAQQRSFVYVLRYPLEPEEGLIPPEQFAQLENEMATLWQQIRTPQAQVNNLLGQIDSLLQMIQGMNIDILLKSYYTALLRYWGWLLSPDSSAYQRACQELSNIVRQPNLYPQGPSLFYCARYLAGLLALQRYWRDHQQDYLRDGIEHLQLLIDFIQTQNDNSIEATRLRKHAGLLIAWAKVELFHLDPNQAPCLQDAWNRLQGLSFDVQAEAQLRAIRQYLLACIKYAEASVNDSIAQKGQLLDQAINLASSVNINAFPNLRQEFVDATSFLRYAGNLIRQALGLQFNADLLQTAVFSDSALAGIARFHRALVRGLLNCTFNQLPGANLPDPQTQFWRGISRLSSALNSLPDNTAFFNQAGQDFSVFQNQFQTDPHRPYALFFHDEARFFHRFLQNNTIVYPNAPPPGLPQNWREVHQARQLFRSLLSNQVFQSIDWSKSGDTGIRLITAFLGQFNAQDLSSTETFSPISALFLFGRLKSKYYQPLINLLNYLLHQPSIEGEDEERLKILLAYAMFRSNNTNLSQSALDVLNNFVSNNRGIEAERLIAKAQIYYYGLNNESIACDILEQVDNERARECMSSWQCAAIPSGPPEEYPFIGFRLNEIDKYSLPFCGYEGADTSYTSYASLLLGLWLNRPFNSGLYSYYPMSILRPGLLSGSHDWRYIRDFSLLDLLDDGIRIGQRVEVTFVFPATNGEYEIVGEVPRAQITASQITHRLRRYVNYNIGCWIRGYYPFRRTMAFNQNDVVRLNTLMVPAEIWEFDHKFTIPLEGGRRESVIFTQMAIGQKKMAFLLTAFHRFYLGICDVEADGLKEKRVSLYDIADIGYPSGLCFDKNDILYISDRSKNTIWMFEGDSCRQIESERLTNELNRPVDLCAFRDSLFIANAGRSDIIRLNIRDVSDVREIQVSTSARPISLCSSAGNLYLTCWEKPAGFSGLLSLQDIFGMRPFINPNGYLYFGNIMTNRIEIFDTNGIRVDSFPHRGHPPLQVLRRGSEGYVCAREAIYVYSIRPNPSFSPGSQ